MTISTTAEPDMQESVFAFLTDPARHPQVKRIDTHAASVFLEGDRALKIKRAVRFPFLDYSTLEKRKAAVLPSTIPGIELIQGSATARGAMAWEAAIASAMAATRSGSSGPDSAR